MITSQTMYSKFPLGSVRRYFDGAIHINGTDLVLAPVNGGEFWTVSRYGSDGTRIPLLSQDGATFWSPTDAFDFSNASIPVTKIEL